MEENNANFLSFAQESYHLPEALEKKSNNSDNDYFIKWGTDNAYPAFLFDLYENTSQFNALINNLHDYILGNKLNIIKTFEKGDDINEVISKCALDMCLFNMCAVQRLRNPLGELLGLAYIDIIKLRLGKENGNNVGFYSNNWSSFTKKYVTIPIDDETVDTDILIFKGAGKGFYPTPIYSGALRSIVTLKSVDEYHLNNIKNGFSATYIINMNNGVPPKEEQQKIEGKIHDKWATEKNVGKFILSFNDNKDNAATITGVPENNIDKKFDALYKTCKENLLMAFRCPSQLAGSTLSANAFNNIEYEQAFKIYSKTVVFPMQLNLIRFFNRATGIENFLTIEPFKINFDEENDSIK